MGKIQKRSLVHGVQKTSGKWYTGCISKNLINKDMQKFPFD